MDLLIAYQFWWIIICIVTGLLFAIVLYYKDESKSFKSWKIWLLGIIRFLVVFLLSFLILEPMLNSIEYRSEKPIIIIATDNSSSIISNIDSVEFQESYIQKINELKIELEDDYEVEQFTFGEKWRQNKEVSFNERYTNINHVFDGITENFFNRNIGALVLVSDGIYNRGSSPLFASGKFDFPIYTIALGDTNQVSDVLIKQVISNQISYLNNYFPLEVIILANKSTGYDVELQILKDQKELHHRTIHIDGDNVVINEKFEILAEELGVQNYEIKLSKLENERNVANNSTDFFIEVIDSKSKVLLLYDAPHPDIAAIRNAIQSKEEFTFKSMHIDDFTSSNEPWNLIMLYQLPNLSIPIDSILETFVDKEIPLLFILSETTDLLALNNLELGINISKRNRVISETFPLFNKSFSAFEVNDEFVEVFNKFPPSLCPSFDYSFSETPIVVCWQDDLNDIAKIPFVSLYNNKNLKLGFIGGTGLWSWRLSNYRMESNHKTFDYFMTGIVQYLVLKQDNSRLRVHHKNSFDESENITFNVELYNESYQKINNPEIRLIIQNSDSSQYSYKLSKKDKSYTLNAGHYRPGRYYYKAIVENEDNSLRKMGDFVVRPVIIENAVSQANHGLLRRLALQNDGQMLYLDEINELSGILQTRGDIKEIFQKNVERQDLLSNKYLLLLILGLLTLEWFIRKYSGTI